MKAVVVGYGSIGARHARILGELGHAVAVASRRRVGGFPCYATMDEAVRRHAPDYVVIASETAGHLADVAALAAAKYSGAVLVEKPLFHASAALPANGFAVLFVAYNLRFHPLIERFRQVAAAEKVLAASVYVGQHLSTWRDADYRRGYSASRERGGGVLLDLSHEIDYLLWILGGWTALVACGGRVSDLEVTSDDAYSLMLRTGKCDLVSLHMNYLHRPGRRSITLVTGRATYEFDLVAGSVTVDGEMERVSADRDSTYRDQHAALLGGRHESLCTPGQAMEVLRVVEAAERSSREMAWVRRG